MLLVSILVLALSMAIVAILLLCLAIRGKNGWISHLETCCNDWALHAGDDTSDTNHGIGPLFQDDIDYFKKMENRIFNFIFTNSNVVREIDELTALTLSSAFIARLPECDFLQVFCNGVCIYNAQPDLEELKAHLSTDDGQCWMMELLQDVDLDALRVDEWEWDVETCKFINTFPCYCPRDCSGCIAEVECTVYKEYRASH